MLCDVLTLDGLGKPFAYESDRVVDEAGISANVRAWAEGGDLSAAIAARIAGTRAPEVPSAKKQPAIWSVIDDLEDRVAAFEVARSPKAATN